MRAIRIIRRILILIALIFGTWALIREHFWMEVVMVGFGLALFALLDLAKWQN